MNIVWFDTLDSTNHYCELLDMNDVEEFTVIAAREQTAGRGQRGNHWVSAAGENLTFSIVLKPVFLPPLRQFELTKAVSLGIVDALEAMGIGGISIKWPNDIYVGNRKICGTLIANTITGGQFAVAVCGIGLNVNQTKFGPEAGRPTSLRLLTRTKADLNTTLTHLISSIERRYEMLRQNGENEIDKEYLNRLYQCGIAARYRHDGQGITATITGVSPTGQLMLRTDEGRELSCAMKEIEFL